MSQKIVIGFLTLAVLTSALAVVYAKHQSRRLFVQLNELQQLRDQMNVEWGQLQLEQSTWATHGRIEKVAREKLHMTSLDFSQMVIVKP